MWIFGSSLVKHVFPYARSYPGGSCLGLEAYLWWQGYSGMTLVRSRRKLATLLKVEAPADFILLHVGGNDLGRTPLKILISTLCNLLIFIRQAMPSARIIWSEILPREWGQNRGLASARKRFNTFAVKKVKQHGGFYLRHRNLPFNNTNYAEDGVHLTDVGNALFLDNIRVGFYHFLLGHQPWFA